ncbi:MAG: hypothetical protein ABIK62_07410 [candidate division WOR-3 bacterium]
MTFTVIGDPNMEIARAFGMLQPVNEIRRLLIATQLSDKHKVATRRIGNQGTTLSSHRRVRAEWSRSVLKSKVRACAVWIGSCA